MLDGREQLLKQEQSGAGYTLQAAAAKRLIIPSGISAAQIHPAGSGRPAAAPAQTRHHHPKAIPLHTSNHY
jgi:hypothetical protein